MNHLVRRVRPGSSDPPAHLLHHNGAGRLGRRETRRLRALVRQRVLVERRRAFLRQTESLCGYWHTIHKPFAILQYSMIGVHIAVAVWLGYAWAW